jgi:DNA processing protein
MTNNMHPAVFWIGLSSIPGIGRVTFRKLASHFGSPERALSASFEELHRGAGLSEKLAAAITQFPWRGPAEQEIEKAANAGVALITADHAEYPDSLRSTPDPPLYLYIRGSLRPEDRNAVAIVGTRKPTHYGTRVTYRMAAELAAAGQIIVSGMARGIDTQAHQGALSVEGRTIAVLGCGIDVAYPPENRGLMDKISRSGAVITENAFGTKPESGYFPARNRIISGLARGTVIVEATEDSGSLITAKYTLEQGRRLYAVPGNIGSLTSKGSNSLIKQGARLVEGAPDILADLGMKAPGARRGPERPLPALSREEEAVFQVITDEPKHIDRIMGDCGAAAGALSGVLITLELKGLAKQLPGKYYVRND